MELLYLWTNTYKVFKNNGFNFGGKYFYDYDNQKNILKISENKNYIADFFNDNDSRTNSRNTKIENITAIVGQNGTGKTTLIELLQKYFVMDRKSHHVEHYVVLVLKHNNEFKVFFPRRSICNSLKIIKDCENIEDHTILNNNEYSYLPLNDYSTIYYSPVVDGQYYGKEESNGNFPDFHDISTNYLMFQCDKDFTTNESRDEDFHALSYPHWYHINKEYYRIITFLANDDYRPDLHEKFKLPEMTRLLLGPRIKDVRLLCDSINSNIGDNAISANILETAEDNRTRFTLLILLNFVYCYARLTKLSIDSDELAQLARNKNTKKQNGPLEKFADKINALLDKLLIDGSCFFNDTYKVNIAQGEGTIVFKMFAEIFTEFRYCPAIELQLQSYSSGELSWLKLYSRFWDLKVNVPLKDNILILIDDGEIYMHPEWQKQFISRIMAMCQSFFPEKKIQIIIATNNPLLLSDMPTHNIIYLDKDENQKITARQIKEQQTFGASVTKILADSFFLQGGMIGDFAKKKINKLINDLKSVDRPNTGITQDKSNLYKTIALLGEPIMRRHLEQKLHETNVISLDERIGHLENEIAALKSQKMKKSEEESQ